MDDGYAKRLGRKLRELRETYSYRQSEVAAAAGITQPTYSSYESGKRAPSSEVLFLIASYYGMLADELIGSCVDLDDDIFFDRLEKTDRFREEAEYLAFSKLKRYSELTREEKELLFCFNRLDKTAQEEVIEYAVFKRGKRNQKEENNEKRDDKRDNR